MVGVLANDLEGIADPLVAQRTLPGTPIGEHIQVSQDGGHGGADFVAHVGQEFALRQVGRFGCQFGLRHRCFGQSSLGDVACDTDHASRSVVASAYKGGVDFRPFGGAVFAAIFDFQSYGLVQYMVVLRGGGQELCQRRAGFGGRSRGQQLVHGMAHRFRCGIAPELLHGRTDVRPPQVHVGGPDHVIDMFGEDPVGLLGGPQFPFHAFAHADVTGEGTVEFAATKLDVIDRDLDRVLVAAFGSVNGLDNERLPLSQLFPMVGPNRTGEIRVDIMDTQGAQFFRRVAQGTARSLVGIHDASLRVEPVYGVCGVVNAELGHLEVALNAFSLRDLGAQHGRSLCDPLFELPVQRMQASDERVEASGQHTDLVAAGDGDRSDMGVVGLGCRGLEMGRDFAQAVADDQPEQQHEHGQQHRDTDAQHCQLGLGFGGDGRIDLVHRNTDRVQPHDVTQVAVESRLGSVPRNQGGGRVFGATVTGQTARVQAPRNAVDQVLAPVENHRANPLRGLRVVSKVLDDRQLFRTGRIGRIPRVIGRELDQVIGMLLAHFLEHAARHVRRGHGLGDEVVFAGVMLHQWADAVADVVPNGQIELQGQLRLLIRELFGVPTNREIGSPIDKPEEQDGECHHNQQELRANALHEAVRGRFRFAFESHAVVQFQQSMHVDCGADYSNIGFIFTAVRRFSGTCQLIRPLRSLQTSIQGRVPLS